MRLLSILLILPSLAPFVAEARARHIPRQSVSSPPSPDVQSEYCRVGRTVPVYEGGRFMGYRCAAQGGHEGGGG